MISCLSRRLGLCLQTMPYSLWFWKSFPEAPIWINQAFHVSLTLFKSVAFCKIRRRSIKWSCESPATAPLAEWLRRKRGLVRSISTHDTCLHCSAVSDFMRLACLRAQPMARMKRLKIGKLTGILSTRWTLGLSPNIDPSSSRSYPLGGRSPWRQVRAVWFPKI